MITEIEELEEVRKELGYSHPELASQLSVGLSTLQTWVYNDVAPRYENLKKVEDWLDKNKEKVG